MEAFAVFISTRRENTADESLYIPRLKWADMEEEKGGELVDIIHVYLGEM